MSEILWGLIVLFITWSINSGTLSTVEVFLSLMVGISFCKIRKLERRK